MTIIKRIPLAAPLLLLAAACSAGTGAEGNTTGGMASVAGAGNPNPGGGAPSASGGSPMNVPLAGSGQAIGDGDQGTFFNPDMTVQIMPPAVGGSGGTGSGGSGGSGIPGDGNSFTSKIQGSITGTAVFTQRGEDVDVVVNLENCADGNHQFRIHDGFSCDNEMTKGVPWSRGTGIGPDSGIACTGGKGMLMYTRSGADKTKNWTVGDHVTDTDLTVRVIIVSDQNDPNSLASCGNFFS